MIWTILNFIFPILILLLAMNCYRKDGKRMKAFYLNMTYNDICRRFYVNMVMLVLIIFLFIQISCKVDVLETFLPITFAALLIRHAIAEVILYFIKKRRVMFVTSALSLISLFVPHLYPMSVTLAIIMVAAIFYPSKNVREFVADPKSLPFLNTNHAELIEKYY